MEQERWPWLLSAAAANAAAEPVPAALVDCLCSHDPAWLDALGTRLQLPLPGRAAQAQFEPELSFGRHFGPPAYDARTAAVVALFYPHQGQWYLPLTVRPTSMQTHAGQISFPGGGVEPGETTAVAVLRELSEELGVAASGVRLLGELSPLYLYNSNFHVTAWVAAIEHRPTFVPDAREVAELLEVPLLQLVERRNRGVTARRARGIGVRVPHIAFGRHRIWGATSMILGELLAVLADWVDPAPLTKRHPLDET